MRALLLALAHSLAVVLVGLAAISLIWLLYAVVSYRLSLEPRAPQGRINSAFRLLPFGAKPLGTTDGGLLLTAQGPGPVLGLIAQRLTVSSTLAWLSNLRHA